LFNPAGGGGENKANNCRPLGQGLGEGKRLQNKRLNKSTIHNLGANPQLIHKYLKCICDCGKVGNTGRGLSQRLRQERETVAVRHPPARLRAWRCHIGQWDDAMQRAGRSLELPVRRVKKKERMVQGGRAVSRLEALCHRAGLLVPYQASPALSSPKRSCDHGLLETVRTESILNAAHEP
jgi:hypothetical protein